MDLAFSQEKILWNSPDGDFGAICRRLLLFSVLPDPSPDPEESLARSVPTMGEFRLPLSRLSPFPLPPLPAALASFPPSTLTSTFCRWSAGALPLTLAAATAAPTAWVLTKALVFLCSDPPDREEGEVDLLEAPWGPLPPLPGAGAAAHGAVMVMLAPFAAC